MAQKYYVVFKGVRVGIYGSWYECAPHVLGFKGSVYRSFKTEDEAIAAYTSYFRRNVDDVNAEYDACFEKKPNEDEISMDSATETNMASNLVQPGSNIHGSSFNIDGSSFNIDGSYVLVKLLFVGVISGIVVAIINSFFK